MRKNFLNKISTLGVVFAVATLVFMNNPLEKVDSTYGYGYWYGSAPSKDSLTLERDCRVTFQGEKCEKISSENTKENVNNNENKAENNSNNQNGNSSENIIPNENKNQNSDKNISSNDEKVTVVLENGNTFSHKKLFCKLPEVVQNNFRVDLSTKFSDSLDSKFVLDISNLENSWIVVWTSKSTFEPKRAITKSELLWLVLKSNCYDLSKNTLKNWQENVVKTWLENNIISDKNFDVNESISREETHQIIVKWGQIDAKKETATKTLEYIWVLEANQEKSSFISREEVANLLVKVLKIYQK